MRIALCIIILLCCSIYSKAQLTVKLYEDKTYINKLEQQYVQTRNDSLKAYTAFKLAYAYKRAKDIQQATQFLEKGTALVGHNLFLQGAADYYRAYVMLGAPDFDKIEDLLQKGDSLLSPFNHTEAYKLRSSAWIVLGVLSQLQGDEKGGLDAYINHGLPLADQSGDDITIATANKFVGISLLNAEERTKANNYLEQALSRLEQSTPESEAIRLEAIVEVTLILAENNIYLNNLPQTKIYLNKALDILNKYPESNAFLFYYYPEGVYYEKTGAIRRGIQSFDKGIALQSGTIENYYINRMKYAKFEALRKIGAYPEAIKVMEELLKSSILLTTDRNSYYNLLAQAYAGAGNMPEAYNWSQKYIAINDSLHATNYKAAMMELEKKYQTSEKEKQINLLQAEKKEVTLLQKNQRLLNWLLGIGALVFFLTLLFLANVLKNNRRNTALKWREVEQQKELQITQAILEGEERERQRIARDLHDGLGGALSGIKIKLSSQQKAVALPVLDEGIAQLEDAIGELRRISRNMMPETLIRSGLEVALRDLCMSQSSTATAIEFQSNGIQKDLPIQVQVNIYRIIQELLTNAIRHGHATKVLIQCLQNEKQFLITVEDNGQGFEIKGTRRSNGIGWSNINNRVDLMKGRIDVASVINEGTAVNIELYV